MIALLRQAWLCLRDAWRAAAADDRTAYLDRAVDLADLERRMRALEEGNRRDWR